MSYTTRRLFFIGLYILMYSGACLIGYHDIGLNTLPAAGIATTYALFACLANLRFKINRTELDLVFSVSGMNILMAGISIYMDFWIKTNVFIILISMLHTYFQTQNYKKFQQEFTFMHPT